MILFSIFTSKKKKYGTFVPTIYFESYILSNIRPGKKKKEEEEEEKGEERPRVRETKSFWPTFCAFPIWPKMGRSREC